MPQTTTVQGRLKVLTPDQNYDTVSDGGNALFAAINAAFTKLSDNFVGRWSNDIILASGGTTTYTHNLGQALTQLKVLIFVSNALLPKATQDAQFTISQSSTDVISIANISGVSKTFQVYILAFPLSVRTTDIDASIDAVITRLEFTGGILLDEMSTPTTPSSGKVAVYAKSDKKLYTKDSLGAEAVVGSGSGSGGRNYLDTYADFSLDPSTGMVNNLTATGNRGSDTTVWGANTTSLLSQTSTALRGTKSAQLVNGSSASNFIESPLFTLDTIDVNTNFLFISFDLNSAGTSVATGDWLLQVIRYNSSGVFQENITPSITSVPSGYYNFKCAFNHSATATDQYAIRFRSNTATARTLTLDTLIVGPQAVVSSAAVGGWLTYTPTYTGFGTVSFNFAQYRRVGDSMEIQAFFTTGTSTAVLASMTLPSGLTMDASKIPIANLTSSAGCLVGLGVSNETANATYQPGSLLANTLTSTSLIYFGPGAATANHLIPKNGDSSFIGNSQNISLNIKIPISQWTANVTLAGNPNIEYAYNTAGTTAAGGSDTTAFANGATGAAIGSIASTTITGNSVTTMRARFQTAIQPTDRVVLEVSDGTSNWFPVGALVNIAGQFYQGGATYGVAVRQFNSTDVDVLFGNAGRLTINASYAATGSAWSQVATSRWRVAKYSGVGLAEIAPATATTPGLITRENVWTAYTPTVGAGFGTVSSLTGFYKIIGDSMFIRIHFVTGTVAANSGLVQIPSGYTINSAKSFASTVGNVGDIAGSWGHNIANIGGNMILATGSSTSGVYLSGSYGGSSMTTALNNTVNGVLSSSSHISMFFEVPLV